LSPLTSSQTSSAQRQIVSGCRHATLDGILNGTFQDHGEKNHNLPVYKKAEKVKKQKASKKAEKAAKKKAKKAAKKAEKKAKKIARKAKRAAKMARRKAM